MAFLSSPPTAPYNYYPAGFTLYRHTRFLTLRYKELAVQGSFQVLLGLLPPKQSAGIRMKVDPFLEIAWALDKL